MKNILWKSVKNCQNTSGLSDNADACHKSKRHSQPDHPHAAAAQTVDVVWNPLSAIGEEGKHGQNDEGDRPDAQCVKHHIFDIRHVTEFALVVKRGSVCRISNRRDRKYQSR